MSCEKRFEGKVCIATGAASGMGFLFCKRFAGEGGCAVLADINGEALDAKVKEITDEGGRAIGVVCDVRDYKQVTAVCEAAVETFGSIDVMVNTAGGAECRICGQGDEFFKNDIEIYDWSIDVNLKGQIHFDHAVMKQMSKQMSGVIINIGSITGEEGCASNISYAAAKSAAMNGLTKSVALAGGKYGIRCVCVAPGPVLTRPGMAGMKTLMGRAAEPDEMIDLMLFLASDKASFITGINVLADGGRNIMRDKN